jgi:hypothetical protein
MGTRFLLVALVGLATVAAAGALTGCGSASDAGRAPDDLLLTYAWSEGSLPPPYHYSYTIRVQADGAGEVTMIPDYAGEGVPVWTEPFTVPQADLDRMYRTMVERGLLSEDWRAVDDPPVGGSSATMSAVAEGRIVEIPAFLEAAQSGRADAIYAALRQVVPEALFADLEARRAAYEAAHERP